MLETALRAKLPLISVRTDDVLNAERILSHLVREDFKHLDIDKYPRGPQRAMGDWLWSDRWPDETEVKKWYEELAANGQTLILVNVQGCEEAFDAGVMPVPRELAADELEAYAADVGPVLDALGGLTLKDLKEVAVLAMSDHGELTPASVTDLRRRLPMTARGLYQVDCRVPFYLPDSKLDDWLSVDGEIWRRNLSRRLRPKGLLFKGQPGTGKTMAAKYLARKLGVPLYRLDLGSIFHRYVGDSEENMRRALAEADRAEPCVLLIDEVEKALKVEDDNAVASRILGSLLWWMQERESRVLVLMTTNDPKALPAELIREERLDGEIFFDYIADYSHVQDFAENLLNSMEDEIAPGPRLRVLGEVRVLLLRLFDTKTMTPASITHIVHDMVRKDLVRS
jgi:hypothetical protein